MTRRRFPDSADRLAYQLGSDNRLWTAAELKAVAYDGPTGSALADIRTDPGGAVIAGSEVEVDATSGLPDFLGPDDDRDVLYLSVNEGPRYPVRSKVVDWVQELEGRLDTALDGAAADATAKADVAQAAAISTASADATAKADAARISAATTIPGASAQVGNYFVMQQGTVSTAQLTPVSGVLYLWPMTLPAATPVDRVAVEVTTVGTGVIRHGVFANDSATGLPVGSGPLASFGTVDVTAIGVKELTLSGVTLPSGCHWYGMAWQGASATPPTIRSMSNATSVGPLNIGPTSAPLAVGRLGYFATPVTGAFGSIPVAVANMHSLFTPRLAYRRA